MQLSRVLGAMQPGRQVQVEATPEQVDAISRIVHTKGASITATETSPEGRPLFTIVKN